MTASRATLPDVPEVELETIDENLFDVITDIMDEKREDWQDFLDDQDDKE